MSRSWRWRFWAFERRKIETEAKLKTAKLARTRLLDFRRGRPSRPRRGQSQHWGQGNAISNLTALGNNVVFDAESNPKDTFNLGEEPWRSDGTAAGTRQMMDIYEGGTGSKPEAFHVLNGYAFFVAHPQPL